MADVQVQCASRGSDDHKAITGLGGPTWWWPSADIIASIEAGTNTFYTLATDGKRADVGVVTEADGTKYLRTHADGKWTNNLLALPACPLPLYKHP